MFLYHNYPLRMRVVDFVLESAKDVGHAPAINAARRLYKAYRLGWKTHADPKDWEYVKEIYEALIE